MDSLFAMANTMFAGHWWFIGAMVLAYVFKPDLVTKLFQKLEDFINGLKFTLLGFSIDFSKYTWDDQLNHFLRDYVISLQSKAVDIKSKVSSSEMDMQQGEEALEGLTQEVVDYFQNSAPENLKKFAIAKFGGDKVAAADYLYRRVKAIAYDLKDKKN